MNNNSDKLPLLFADQEPLTLDDIKRMVNKEIEKFDKEQAQNKLNELLLILPQSKNYLTIPPGNVTYYPSPQASWVGISISQVEQSLGVKRYFDNFQIMLIGKGNTQIATATRKPIYIPNEIKLCVESQTREGRGRSLFLNYDSLINYLTALKSKTVES